MPATLLERIPSPEDFDADLLDRFLGWVADQGIELYRAQEEALLELFTGRNVILNTPTGSGKSLVATAMHFRSFALGRRSYYTSPIKALVSEKFFALCRDFGAANVGLVTGDAKVNEDAKIICCTAEILANMCLREGAEALVDDVVMDEFHYYGDRDRGVAWQVPLLILKHARFLLMSATLGDPDRFSEILTKLTRQGTSLVRSQERPVPLDFEYRETPLHETVADLVFRNRAPIYIVSFTQRACAETAQDLLSVDFCTKDEKKKLAEALGGTRFDSPYGKEVQKLLRHGVAVHHAGLLPKYRLLVERLAQRGLLKIVCGTDTLGVGINIPLRTVLFTQLCKYDGEKTSILSVRDFLQISGRAGRKGFDDRGTVVVQAPEHVIENIRLEAKAANDPGKKRKLVKRKPPEFGYVHWDRNTFERLIKANPEPLLSRFQVTHAMLLHVLQRPYGGCRAMIRLLRDSHDPPAQKRAHKTHARALYNSLLEAGVIERQEHGIAVHAELGAEFSMNQALSLYLVETIGRLEPASDSFALDALTLAESILEDPDLILRKQLDKLKGELVAKLKAEGVEYDDRMEKLRELEYPKPNREFVYETFNAFAKRQPWVGENIRPKSVAREMIENLQGFSEYVKTYELQRVEGLVLRYLTDVYKVMVQTVRPVVRRYGDVDPEPIEDIIAYFGAIVRQVDSSLLDEWERMRDPMRVLSPTALVEEPRDDHDVTRDPRGFTVLVRNHMIQLLRALARRDYAAALELVEERDPLDAPWTRERLSAIMEQFFAEHPVLRLDTEARGPRKTILERGPTELKVRQVVSDEQGDDDWVVEGTIDLGASRLRARPVLVLERIGR